MRLYELAFNYVKSQKGRLPELAEETGLGYQWLAKFSQGRILEPSVNKIEALLIHRRMVMDLDEELYERVLH